MPCGASLAAAGLVLLAGAGCRATSPRPELVLVSASEAGWTRFTLRPAPGVRINARVLPAVEFTDGTVLRLASPHLTADSAYFSAPPNGSVPAGTPHRGIARASICRDDEAVCRRVAFPWGRSNTRHPP